MSEFVQQSQALPVEQTEELQRAFLIKVYSWMFAGLMITGIFALLTVSSEMLLELVFSNRFVFFGLIIAELGLVIWLSARIEKMTAVAATTAFLVYATLSGLTLSVVFLAYTAESLASTFFVTGGTFGIMSVYGYVTKRDLSTLGSFFMMGLVGIIIASVVNIWLGSDTLYWIVTYVGILIFVGLTAYDTQKIKNMSGVSLQGGEIEQKGAIMGALRLYLDFINLFLLLLRVMGNRR